MVECVRDNGLVSVQSVFDLVLPRLIQSGVFSTNAPFRFRDLGWVKWELEIQYIGESSE